MAHKKWSEIREQNSKADPAQVAEHRRAMERELTLAELRKARSMTQVQLAAALESTQPGVARLERQADLYLSTLRSYVEALGGRLELLAVFPDGATPIGSFEELAERDEVPA